MTHDDCCGHHHCCCGSGKDKKHEYEHNRKEYMKDMTKEELTMKKEKPEKKLAMVKKLLEEKK